MIAVEELAGAPVLASVPREDLVRVARAAGDVRLASGEYAVHEGDVGIAQDVGGDLGGEAEVHRHGDEPGPHRPEIGYQELGAIG